MQKTRCKRLACGFTGSYLPGSVTPLRVTARVQKNSPPQSPVKPQLVFFTHWFCMDLIKDMQRVNYWALEVLVGDFFFFLPFGHSQAARVVFPTYFWWNHAHFCSWVQCSTQTVSSLSFRLNISNYSTDTHWTYSREIACSLILVSFVVWHSKFI